MNHQSLTAIHKDRRSWAIVSSSKMHPMRSAPTGSEAIYPRPEIRASPRLIHLRF